MLTKYKDRNILNALGTSFKFKLEKKEFSIKIKLTCQFPCKNTLSSLLVFTKTDLTTMYYYYGEFTLLVFVNHHLTRFQYKDVR